MVSTIRKQAQSNASPGAAPAASSFSRRVAAGGATARPAPTGPATGAAAAGACPRAAAGGRAAAESRGPSGRGAACQAGPFFAGKRRAGARGHRRGGAWKAPRPARRTISSLTAQRSIDLHDLPDRVRLFGEYDRNLSAIESSLDVAVHADGDRLLLAGEATAVGARRGGRAARPRGGRAAALTSRPTTLHSRSPTRALTPPSRCPRRCCARTADAKCAPAPRASGASCDRSKNRRSRSGSAPRARERPTSRS